MQSREYDVLIVGGGMVGASLACALKPIIEREGLRVALVEAFAIPEADSAPSLPEYHYSFDARSTALSYGTRQAYESMGLWAELAERVCPIEHIHVSDKGRFGSTRLHARDHQLDALGYVVENQWLGQVLLHQMQQINGLDLLCPGVAGTINRKGDWVEVEVTYQGEPQSLRTQLLVIADGSRSQLAQQLGIESEEQPYGQYAIIANVLLGQGHESVAYERFTPEGPLALLPMVADAEGRPRSALVLTAPEATAEEWLALSDEGFLALIQERFGYRLGRLQGVGERAHYPLALVQAKEQIRPGVVVVGNAAHTLHPVAGQGFNLAFRGVMQLAEHIENANQSGDSLGALVVLEDYLKARSADQQKIIQFSDHTMRLFSNRDPLLGLLRDTGLVALDVLPAAKQVFARHAMGLA